MSGDNYKMTCPKCGASNELRGKAMTLALTCQSCHVYFRIGQWNKSNISFSGSARQAIPLGSKGRIDDFVYEVMGFVVKQETKHKYRWREYLLFNPYKGYAFLSEYEGHWNFVWPIENGPAKNAADTNFFYNNAEFKLYQKYTASVIYARGEFFFDVVDITSSTVNYEYIAPPFMFALEENEDSVIWCHGEYFSQQRITEAFSIPKSNLPSKSGIGYTQPFDTAFSELGLILFVTLILLSTLLIHLALNNSAENKVIFQEDYNYDALKDQKMLVTPSFNLESSAQSLEIHLYAPLSNDWFLTDFSLIDEGTGAEYNFTKEIEYYSGYEDGGSWSEGSQSGEAFLSRIPSGKYHINIYPQFSLANHSFSVAVKRDVPILSNFFITCLGLLAFPLFYFIRKRYREQTRWSDSDYSPYSTTE